MNIEATEEKSLAQIGYEAIIAAGKYTFLDTEWPKLTTLAREQATIFAAAVEAAVLARQPQTVAAGELADACAALAKDWDFQVSSSQGCMDEAAMSTYDRCRDQLRATLASCAAAPTYYETAKRPPTEADGKDILAWSPAGKCWLQSATTGFSSPLNPTLHPYWMPQPPAPVPPVSAEDAAFEVWFNAECKDVNNKEKYRAAWKNGAFAATQKPA